MDEQKLIDEIRQSAEKIPTPDALEPEAVRRKLEQEGTGKTADRSFDKRSMWRRYAARTAEIAAALAVVFAAGRWMGSMNAQTQNGGVRPTPQSFAKTADTVEEDAAPEYEETFAPIGSEEALFEKLLGYQTRRRLENMLYSAKNEIAYYEEDAEAEVQMIDGGTGMTADSAAPMEAGADYSQTNLREMGVDEGDIVKTDGQYIYIIKNNNSVKIIRADGTKLELAATLEPEMLNETVQDLYVTGDMLNLITSGSQSSMVESGEDVYRTESYNYAKVLSYDISDGSSPKFLGSVEQEGFYRDSRKAGDYIYLFTEYLPQIGISREDSTIMPLVNGARMEAGDVYVPESIENTSYLVIGSMNVGEPEKTVSHKAVVSGASRFYVSSDSIFICNEDWQNSKDVTNILKFSYQDGSIWGVGAATVDGYLNDTFSLDEYDGHLRAVATDWNSGDEINALYIFDEKMNMTGKIADIAPGETIRSARFLGDAGYFVTFRQTDPLFSVDLSDPSDPQILGELKISGFSSYLHSYGKDRLLGIGYEADEDTGRTTGVKLSMFDISDPSNVTELKKFVIDEADYVPGLSNYRAIMINPDKNLFGFICDNHYLVFSYDEQDGFQNMLTYDLSGGNEQGNYWYAYDTVRGLYIADTFYLAESDMVRAFDMNDDFTEKNKLEY